MEPRYQPHRPSGAPSETPIVTVLCLWQRKDRIAPRHEQSFDHVIEQPSLTGLTNVRLQRNYPEIKI